MDVPGISRPVLVVLIVVAVLLFAYGAGTALGRLTRHTDTQTRTLAAVPTVVVTSRNADVNIVASDRSDVRVTTREQRSVWGGGHVDLRGDAGGLQLRDSCRDIPVVDDPCHVSLRLDVPRSVSVRVVTGTGDVAIVASHPQTIHAEAATGDVILVVPDLTYAVDAQSDVGDDKVLVHVDDASPRKIQAHTNTGDVIVSTDAP
jgi:hypothetical protein